MASGFLAASDLAVGALGAPFADPSNTYANGVLSESTVAVNATHGKVIEVRPSVFHTAVVFSTPGTPTTGELYGHFISRQSGDYAGFFSAGSGASPNYYGGGAFQGNDDIRIHKWVSGTYTSRGVLNANFPSTISIGTEYKLRFQWDLATGALKLKGWLAADSEPAGWGLEVTDTSLTTAGEVGIQSWKQSFDLVAIGWGTAGDAAPTAPVGGSSLAPFYYQNLLAGGMQ